MESTFIIESHEVLSTEHVKLTVDYWSDGKVYFTVWHTNGWCAKLTEETAIKRFKRFAYKYGDYKEFPDDYIEYMNY